MSLMACPSGWLIKVETTSLGQVIILHMVEAYRESSIVSKGNKTVNVRKQKSNYEDIWWYRNI